MIACHLFACTHYPLSPITQRFEAVINGYADLKKGPRKGLKWTKEPLDLAERLEGKGGKKKKEEEGGKGTIISTKEKKEKDREILTVNGKEGNQRD